MINIVIEQGVFADYKALGRFHYRHNRPATVAGVYRAIVHLRSGRAELAGVVVLSYPVPRCAERHRAFHIGHHGLADNLRFVNTHLRTISRVIVHPAYRGLGLATQLIRQAITNAPTPFVEARALMGQAIPMFERAGMTRVEPITPGRPVYYWTQCPTRHAPRSAQPLNETHAPHSGQSSAIGPSGSGVSRRS